MLLRQSIRYNFLLKLIVAMATLVLVTSFSLYIYIRYNSNTQLQETLEQQAHYLLKNYPNLEEALHTKKDLLKNTYDTKATIVNAPYIHYQPKLFKVIKKDDKYYLQGYFPYNFQSQDYLLLTKDITSQIKLEKMVYKAVILVNIISLIVIIFYAFVLSKMLIKPLEYFSNKIAKMNELKLSKIDSKTLPNEFKPLANSINQLIAKIENFIYYKKELFIGAAHELKTPLAVMKTKSQVTLLKKNKTIDSLTEAIEQNVKSINDLNAIVESILAFGRAEGAQFEEAKEIDIIKLLLEIVDEFEIIAIKEEKFIIKKISIKSLKLKIQPMLFRHIIQNLMQNALKFTKKRSNVEIRTFICKDNLVIRILDNGPGIPKDFDLFAPFKRSKNSSGTGLGLFLAKSAADSMAAKLSIKNRNRVSGAVANLIIPI